MLRHSAPPKIPRSVATKKKDSITSSRLTVIPFKKTAGSDAEKPNPLVDTSLPSTAMVTGIRDRPESNEQEPSVVKPVPEVDAGVREDSEAREEPPQRDTSMKPVIEEVKEPTIAFEVNHTDLSDARYSPEPPKVEDYADEEDGPTFDDVLMRESRKNKERQAQAEAAAKAELLRKEEEAALAERQGKLAGMSDAAQNILSKYS